MLAGLDTFISNGFHCSDLRQLFASLFLCRAFQVACQGQVLCGFVVVTFCGLHVQTLEVNSLEWLERKEDT